MFLPSRSLVSSLRGISFLHLLQETVEWTTHTSYEIGLETERAAQEKLEDLNHEQVRIIFNLVKKLKVHFTGWKRMFCYVEPSHL